MFHNGATDIYAKLDFVVLFVSYTTITTSDRKRHHEKCKKKNTLDSTSLKLTVQNEVVNLFSLQPLLGHCCLLCTWHFENRVFHSFPDSVDCLYISHSLDYLTHLRSAPDGTHAAVAPKDGGSPTTTHAFGPGSQHLFGSGRWQAHACACAV